MTNGTILITGNTFNCKDEIKDLGGKWNASAKGWEVPEANEQKARELVAREGLSIDGKLVRAGASTPPGAMPGTSHSDPEPQPNQSNGPAPEGEAKTPQSDVQLVSYASLEAVGPGAKPKVVESTYGSLKVRNGFVLLDATNTCNIEGKRSLLNQAYKEIARLAGVQVILPKRIDVYDEQFGKNIEVQNPYITKYGGIVLAVECRAIAVGITETGNLHICERTCYMHFLTNLLHTLAKIIDKKPICGEFMTRAAFLERPDAQRKWAFYVQTIGPDDHSIVGIAVDLEHDEIRHALAGYQQLVKFGDRGVQTKTEAMAIKNFPGLGTPDVTQAMTDGGGVTFRRVIQVEGGSKALKDIVDRLRENLPIVDRENVTWDTSREDITDADMEEVVTGVEEDEPGNGSETAGASASQMNSEGGEQ